MGSMKTILKFALACLMCAAFVAVIVLAIRFFIK